MNTQQWQAFLKYAKTQKIDKNLSKRTILYIYRLHIGRLRGRIAGVATPPPPPGRKIYKRGSFLGHQTTPPPFPDRMVDKSSHERLHPPFKISRSAYVSVRNNHRICQCSLLRNAKKSQRTRLFKKKHYQIAHFRLFVCFLFFFFFLWGEGGDFFFFLPPQDPSLDTGPD